MAESRKQEQQRAEGMNNREQENRTAENRDHIYRTVDTQGRQKSAKKDKFTEQAGGRQNKRKTETQKARTTENKNSRQQTNRTAESRKKRTTENRGHRPIIHLAIFYRFLYSEAAMLASFKLVAYRNSKNIKRSVRLEIIICAAHAHLLIIVRLGDGLVIIGIIYICIRLGHVLGLIGIIRLGHGLGRIGIIQIHGLGPDWYEATGAPHERRVIAICSCRAPPRHKTHVVHVDHQGTSAVNSTIRFYVPIQTGHVLVQGVQPVAFNVSITSITHE